MAITNTILTDIQASASLGETEDTYSTPPGAALDMAADWGLVEIALPDMTGKVVTGGRIWVYQNIAVPAGTVTWDAYANVCAQAWVGTSTAATLTTVVGQLGSALETGKSMDTQGWTSFDISGTGTTSGILKAYRDNPTPDPITIGLNWKTVKGFGDTDLGDADSNVIRVGSEDDNYREFDDSGANFCYISITSRDASTRSDNMGLAVISESQYTTIKAIGVWSSQAATSTSANTSALWEYDSIKPALLTSASQLKVSSSDAADAAQVKIEGLDSNWEYLSETVTLTGQSQVTTTNSFLRVNRAYTVDSGQQDGVVYIYTGGASSGVPSTPANTLERINANKGVSRTARWSVEAGHKAQIVKFGGHTTSANNITFELKKQGGANGASHVVYEKAISAEEQIFEGAEGLIFEEKTDIMVILTSDSGTDGADGFLQLALVK